MKYTPHDLFVIAKRIYSNSRLTLQQEVTTVYRPLYAPFHVILKWIPAHSRLLDLGCGTGVFFFLAQHLCNLGESYGLDTNPELVDIAESVNTFPNLHFLRTNENVDQLIQNSEVITCIDLFHHIPPLEFRGFLDNLLKNIRAKNIIIIKDLDPFPRWKALANQMTDYLSTKSKANYISMPELKARLINEGFEIRFAQRLDKHIWNHYLVVAKSYSQSILQ